MTTSASYVCDTIPAARLAITPSSDPQEPTVVLDDPEPFSDPHIETSTPPRKLCVRHQRMADEGTNLKLQQVRLSCVQ